ncbi:MAG: hypothetical protein M3288_03200 [Thermoproteota archaeon]|nr:hypothetical protein [Thermoproteota archaeon]
MYKIDGMAKEREGWIHITTTTRSGNEFIPPPYGRISVPFGAYRMRIECV